METSKTPFLANFIDSLSRRFPHALSLTHNGWIGYIIALGAVVLVTLFVALLAELFQLEIVLIVYLIAILATAITFGSGPAVVAAVASVLVYDWFYVEPLHTLNVADPVEWVSLLLFLLTAIITGQLAAGQRRRAHEAEEREREASVLYDVVRLLDGGSLETALAAIAERLHQELQLAGIVVEIAMDDGMAPARAEFGEPEALRLIHEITAGSARILGEGTSPSRFKRGTPGRWIKIVPPRPPTIGHRLGGDLLYIVPVRARERRIGSIMLALNPRTPRFGRVHDRLLSVVATQLGVTAERSRLRREATEAEILRRTDELKTALLNAVSHDLRTPLASIIASAGSLGQKDVAWTEEERQDFTEAIEQEAQRLNRIVGNLLDLSRMESGSLVPEKGWYDFAALVDDVLGRLSHVTARHILVVEIPEDLPPMPIDYIEIDQVLTNIIENATKYTPPGTEIKITVRRVGNEIRTEIADSGPGIPAAALSHLFEPYYRVEGKGFGPQGTGLGLAVAKGLVEAHGGRIWAENRTEGGVVFAFILPLGVQPSAESRMAG